MEVERGGGGQTDRQTDRQRQRQLFYGVAFVVLFS